MVENFFNGIYIIKTLNVSFCEEELPFFRLPPKLLWGRECNYSQQIEPEQRTRISLSLVIFSEASGSSTGECLISVPS